MVGPELPDHESNDYAPAYNELHLHQNDGFDVDVELKRKYTNCHVLLGNEDHDSAPSHLIDIGVLQNPNEAYFRDVYNVPGKTIVGK